LETRLESKSFEPLLGFLAFLVQKVWPKNNKILIRGLIDNFVVFKKPIEDQGVAITRAVFSL